MKVLRKSILLNTTTWEIQARFLVSTLVVKGYSERRRHAKTKGKSKYGPYAAV